MTSACARTVTSSTRWLSTCTDVWLRLSVVIASSDLDRARSRSVSCERARLLVALAGDFGEVFGELLFLGFQREQFGGLLSELELQAADRLALLADLCKLGGGLGFHLLDAHFEPARRHREFGAELVLVGLDLGHRHRRHRFEPPHGEPHRAGMHDRDDADNEHARDQKPDRDIHDRFDHWITPPQPPRNFYHNATTKPAVPA